MVARTWVWGNKRMGYSVRKLARKVRPYISEVWLGSKLWRTDEHATFAGAIKYAKQRKRSYYGNMTPAQAIAKYGTKRRG